MTAAIRDALIKQLKTMGFFTVAKPYYDRMEVWRQWYTGYVAAFHKYTIYNGQQFIQMDRARLNMAKRACEDWANLLWNDECAVSVGESGTAFDAILVANDFTRQTQTLIEKAYGIGTGAYVVYPDDSLVARVDYVTGDAVLPLEWYNDECKSCAFASMSTNQDGTQGVCLMVHLRQPNGSYKIINKYFRLQTSGAGLSEVEPPAGVVPEYTSEVALFSLVRPNIVNNLQDGPMGISIYANAVDALKAIDAAFDGFVTAIKIGRPRLAVSGEALKLVQIPGVNGAETKMVPAFDPNDIVFYNLDVPEQKDGKPIIQDVSTDYRADKFQDSLQAALTIFGEQIGMGEKAYKWDQGSVATATQVIAESSTMLRTMSKHQQGLRTSIETVARAICSIAGIAQPEAVTVEFDDSAVRDKDAERARAFQWVTAGMFPFWKYLAVYEDYDEDEAKAIAAEAAGANQEAQDLFKQPVAGGAGGGKQTPPKAAPAKPEA